MVVVVVVVVVVVEQLVVVVVGAGAMVVVVVVVVVADGCDAGMGFSGIAGGGLYSLVDCGTEIVTSGPEGMASSDRSIW